MTEILGNEESAQQWFRDRFALAPECWSRLEEYGRLLTEENERQNLVAASTLPNLWVRHLADSAQLLNHVNGPTHSWMDLGSGAGLPGLVIAILSDAPVYLVESRKLRCQFLRDVAEKLNLSNVHVVESRLELVPSQPMSVISARAFAPLDKLMGLARRFATEETVWLLPKGRNAQIELATMPQRWQTMFHVEQSLTDADSRILVGRGQFPTTKREKK